jgi:hypothetical protein
MTAQVDLMLIEKLAIWQSDMLTKWLVDEKAN